ncbi:hypothetical protein RvY_00825 [Ramazzottius varieornatus]|uniref:Uncharacterized protein n=1 Tax=Ramazzottius varieornatus TaxID=947166 RepID=A0A1D1UPH3_RAMVA|nr:hypothetical protein RvY_00825 [Ramazzottius varieornatus]
MVEAVVGHENFIVTWKDSDNDSIHVTSESEFTECVDHTAWRTRRGDLIKLYVRSASQEDPHGKNKFEGKSCFDVQ